MASTDKTANYQLPQWVGSDHPTWQGDLNDAFKKIDDGMKKNANDIQNVIDSSHATPNYVSITCEMWDNGLLAYQNPEAKAKMDEIMPRGDVNDSYFDADNEFRRY